LIQKPVAAISRNGRPGHDDIDIDHLVAENGRSYQPMDLAELIHSGIDPSTNGNRTLHTGVGSAWLNEQADDYRGEPSRPPRRCLSLSS
jgi:hypothetical protein